MADDDKQVGVLIPSIHHVWVSHIHGEPRPGLLVWWRRVLDGRGKPHWEGWVVYVLPSVRGATIQQDWVLAESIKRRG